MSTWAASFKGKRNTATKSSTHADLRHKEEFKFVKFFLLLDPHAHSPETGGRQNSLSNDPFVETSSSWFRAGRYRLLNGDWNGNPQESTCRAVAAQQGSPQRLTGTNSSGKSIRAIGSNKKEENPFGHGKVSLLQSA
jgi:hypothetical protein